MGTICTPIQLIRNMAGVFKLPRSDRFSDQLLEKARMDLAIAYQAEEAAKAQLNGSSKVKIVTRPMPVGAS